MSTRLSLSHFQFQHNFMHWLGAAGRVAPAKYWLMIAVVLVAVAVPMFVGLFVALPMLEHATWHLYRRAVGG